MIGFPLRLLASLAITVLALASCHGSAFARSIAAAASATVGTGTYPHDNANISYGPGRINEGGTSSINGTYAQMTFCGTSVAAYYGSFNWEQGVPPDPWNGDHSVAMYAGGKSAIGGQDFHDDSDGAPWSRLDVLVISGLTPGIHTVSFHNARYFSGFGVAGPCDTVLPTNPIAVETHGIAADTWQNAVNAPVFLLSGASDNQGVAGYNIYWGTNPAGTGTYYQAGTTYSPGVVTDGTYYLRVRTRDINGNYANWATLFTFCLDTTPPDNPTAQTEDHGQVSDVWQNTLDSPSFTWSGAADALSGLAGYNVYWGADPAGTASTWQIGETFAPGAQLDGVYYLRLQTLDAAGNLSDWSNAFIFCLDRQSPENPLETIEIHGAASAMWQSGVQEPFFNWSGAADGLSGIGGYHVYFGEDPLGASMDWQMDASFGTTPLPDGKYFLRLQTGDAAGNLSEWVTAFTFCLDTLPPGSVFIDPPDRGSKMVAGQTVLWGTSTDVTSGVAGVDLSLDGGASWQALKLEHGEWFFAWNTNGLPDGWYEILARARDAAGNIEHTAHSRVLVANDPPVVDIPESWLIWEEAALAIEEQHIPLSRVIVLVLDPQERWPALEMRYEAGNIPQSITWNRRFGDGTLAPVGEYRVLVEAQDVLGNKGVDEGRLLIPLPVLLPELFPTSLPVVEEEEVPEPEPTQPIILPTAAPEPVVALSEPVPTPEPEPQPESFPFWQVFGMGGLLAGLAAASLADPRPAALRRMQQTLRQIANQQKLFLEE